MKVTQISTTSFPIFVSPRNNDKEENKTQTQPKMQVRVSVKPQSTSPVFKEENEDLERLKQYKEEQAQKFQMLIIQPGKFERII